MPNLRSYQIAAVEAMVASSNTGGLILCATGSGKTFMASEFFRRLIDKGLMIVDELTLLHQARSAIQKSLNESVGIVGKGLFQPRRITVSTVQSLYRHRNDPAFSKWFKSIQAIIIDEVHLAINRQHIDIVTKIRPLAVYGLTATLELQKPHIRLPVIALTGPVIYTYPLSQGIEEGYLAEGVVLDLKFRDPLRLNLRWSEQTPYRVHVCLNKARNDVVEAMVREGLRRGHRVIVLVEHKVHLRKLDKRFADIRHATLSGAVLVTDRIRAMKQMDAGNLDLILATRVFSKGVDLETVSLIVDATGLPSRNSVQQRFGRGTRKHGDKKLIYVNISDTGNLFEGAAKSRRKALEELGIPVVAANWAGDAAKVFDRITV